MYLSKVGSPFDHWQHMEPNTNDPNGRTPWDRPTFEAHAFQIATRLSTQSLPVNEAAA